MGDQDNELVAASATSSSDLWVVGYYRESPDLALTLIEHWDGTSWAVVPSPNVPEISNYLTAVTALSPNDVWAVGYSEDQSGFVTGPAHNLTLHWDGTAWTIVDSPNAIEDNDNYLQGVKGISSTDVWAVGYAEIGAADAISMHWDGSAWSLVDAPQPGSPAFLYAVDGTSSTDLWAVGYYFDSGLNFHQPLFAHWDGLAWSAVASSTNDAHLAYGVTAVSPDAVWVVGTTNEPTDPTTPFAQHWDGQKWSVDSEPVIRGSSNLLASATALSASDVWAAGSYIDVNTGATRTMVQHWDGVTFFWTPMDTPNIGEKDNRLGGITSISDAAELWAVGSYKDELTGALRTLTMQTCPVRIGGAGFEPEEVGTNRFGATVGWTIALGAPGAHSVTEVSGMGLFNSGLRDPPASFAYKFIAAGSYPVIDLGTGDTMSVEIPMEAFPRRGSVSTRFRVSWAAYNPGQPFRVFDVQIRRPGSNSFEDWKVGEQHAASQFVPDTGPGRYQFRARLRDTRNGSASGYSLPISIEVG